MEFERFNRVAACTSFTEGKTRREMYECAGLAVKNHILKTQRGCRRPKIILILKGLWIISNGR